MYIYIHSNLNFPTIAVFTFQTHASLNFVRSSCCIASLSSIRAAAAAPVQGFEPRVALEKPRVVAPPRVGGVQEIHRQRLPGLHSGIRQKGPVRLCACIGAMHTGRDITENAAPHGLKLMHAMHPHNIMLRQETQISENIYLKTHI